MTLDCEVELLTLNYFNRTQSCHVSRIKKLTNQWEIDTLLNKFS